MSNHEAMSFFVISMLSAINELGACRHRRCQLQKSALSAGSLPISCTLVLREEPAVAPFLLPLPNARAIHQV
jgi:hypothetical protein